MPTSGAAHTDDGADASRESRILELEQQQAALIHGLTEVRSDIERVAASRAWRLGHGLSGALARLAGRRPRTDGGVARALTRLDRLAQIDSRLAPGAPGPEAERELDLRRLYERSGPLLRRGLRIDLLEGRRRWVGRPGPQIGIVSPPETAPSGPELETALTALGWTVSRPARGPGIGQLDYLLVADTGFDVAGVDAAVVVMAWIDDDVGAWLSRPWLDRYDLALAPAEVTAEAIRAAGLTAVPVVQADTPPDAARLREILVRHAQTLSFCLKLGSPDWATAERGGDLYFARALRAELRRRGYPCRIQPQDRWEDSSGLQDDVVITLRGRGRYRPKPGQLNLLWNISHPAEVSGEECDVYDLVCVASARFAEELRGRTRTRVIVLEQATDPRVFFPEPDPRLAHELAFVGNSRGVLRPVLAALASTSRDLAVYGSGWEGLIDSRLVAADFVPNPDLHRVYSSAGVVLCDHWEDMRQRGFVSNRVFDAAACGAPVISDDVAGISELFEDTVPTYRTPGELRTMVERVLADPAQRARHADRARELVLSRHTFAHRVDALLSELDRLRTTPARPLTAVHL